MKLKNILLILLLIPIISFGQEQSQFAKSLKKTFKFATFYGAVNGGNSISDVEVYSITNGLETEVIETPFDYSITFGIRKIARLGYENREKVFYDGTENSYADAATRDNPGGSSRCNKRSYNARVLIFIYKLGVNQ